MQFCYSDTTFNFKLKSHARFSGRDRGRQLRAAEVSPFGAGRPRRKWVPARPVASGGTAAPTAREAARVMAEAEASSRCLPVGPPTGSTAAWGRAGPCVHTRTHAHPHTHACTHAHMHTRARTCTHTRMHVCTRTHTRRHRRPRPRLRHRRGVGWGGDAEAGLLRRHGRPARVPLPSVAPWSP